MCMTPRYAKCLQALDELEVENKRVRDEVDIKIAEEKERMDEKKDLVDEMSKQYFDFKKGVAKEAVNSRFSNSLLMRQGGRER